MTMYCCVRVLVMLTSIVSLLGCSSTATSKVRLIVDADDIVREQTASLRIVLAGRPAGTLVWEEAPPRIFDQTAGAWPVELMFPPKDGDSSREFSVSAIAMDRDRTELVAGYALGHFTQGNSELRLMLTADCLSSLVRCGAEKTCRDGQCVDANLSADAGVADVGVTDGGLSEDVLDGGADSCVSHAVYRDEDSDGFGVASSRLLTCTPMEGYVDSDGDCDDASNTLRPGVEEVCDGIDNNCDLQIDEDCLCISGQSRACGTDTGECALGVQHCVAGIWSATCEGERAAVVESCDGRDNDCDTVADDDATCASRPHAEGDCTAGACRYVCQADYGDCDSTPSNGCEASLLTDARNCGRCRNSCGVRACDGGVCDAGTEASWCTGDFCGISSTGAPSARLGHTAVWTGAEMLVWGGWDGDTELATGGRYNPATDTWAPLATAGAPSARDSHTAVWTGSEMIIWGGSDDDADSLNTGGRYNPVTDTWASLATAGAPSARDSHSAVWTGSEMFVWGGDDAGAHIVSSGGRYNPAADRWSPFSLTGTPVARAGHTAVWTGSEMVVWGGQIDRDTRTGEGDSYDPAINSWSPLSSFGAPRARYLHVAVWTGSEMIVWGGSDGLSGTLSTGGRYNPTTNSWSVLSMTGRPPVYHWSSAVWTGSEVLVWGGMVGFDHSNEGWVWRP